MSFLFYFQLWSLLLQPLVYSQVLSGVQIGAPGNFSTTCNATFYQKVSCNLKLYEIAIGQRIPTSRDLPDICTATCLNELEILRQKQLSDCCTSDLVVTGDATYPATYASDILLFTYNYICLNNPWNSNATGATSTELCSDCNLLIQQAQLDSPLGYDDDLASSYSSLTSSCGVTKYPTSSQSSYSLNRTTTQTTGRKATATAAVNACKTTYTIKPGDTCRTFSVTQLRSWNPNINTQCSNLNQLEGYQICISFPGPPSVNVTGSASVTAPVMTIPTNLALNTSRHCGKYYKVVDGDSCASISVALGISLNDLYFLNPMINSTCGNLLLGTYYCVEAVGNIATYSGYKPSGRRTMSGPCFEMNAPSSCYGLGYMSTAIPFTWPAVGTQPPAATRFPNVTATKDLPLAPGTPDSCRRYTQHFNTSSKRNINECGWVAWIHTRCQPRFGKCATGSVIKTSTKSVSSVSPTVTYSPDGSCGGGKIPPHTSGSGYEITLFM
ncbi:uncharacterized protein TRIVIDRAFT_200487 [Trichoderma virens Gv29-8]|uniref:LysM domain-containing protein n=1 Tax=Hypocrea virens (strain Gv29-8 / FGSC 10586) TaxID=413071 RepID=G9MSD1_HYPVG|nr:uncharacterized protein TRIVIDRAFT_200487 [Trichoderma virens Gv29-8]EHK22148.1 hypothetical protein TRIVIDRAFT_200487 [Trichoderma virens Gv29-8]UKZ47179.1 hypothetical protein TrVGV298_001393 [Trichoderma virens]